MRRQALFGLGLAGTAIAALQAAIGCAQQSRNGAHLPLSTDRDKIAHLLRRAGFGYSLEDLDTFRALGVEGAIDRLLNYESVDDSALEERLKRLHFDTNKPQDMQQWWLVRMIYTQRPLQEKMALFWHGLLVSALGKVPVPRARPEQPNPPNLMLNQNQFFRQHALDDFPTIMKGISRDPAMIVYLDSRENRRGAPNENYARELMELFTLGITGPDGQPNYTEQDVREAARAFTGWSLDRQGRYTFNAAQHDPGPKTIFGKTGTFNGDDVIDLIMAHPSCAPYICRRLFAFFAYDEPEPDVLTPVVDAFKRNGGSVREAVRAVLTSPAFYSEKAYRAKVKSPVEFVAGVARTVQAETDAFGFNMSAGRMGQVLFYPPNVAGWPGGLHWFNTSAWLARLNHVGQLTANRQDAHTRPLKLAPIVQRFDLYTPDKMVDFVLDLVVDGQVTPDQRQVLLKYATDGVQWPDPPKPTKGATGAKGTAAPADASPTLDESHPIVDRKFRGLFYLVMSSPEYQLA